MLNILPISLFKKQTSCFQNGQSLTRKLISYQADMTISPTAVSQSKLLNYFE